MSSTSETTAAATPTKGDKAPKGEKCSSANETNQKLLEAIIKQIPDKGLSWEKISEELGCTHGAARERWRRYKIANSISSPAVPADGDTPKKARTSKRKNDEVAGDEGDKETATPAKKTPAKKAKVVKPDDKVEEDASEEKKTPAKKKATPKKAALMVEVKEIEDDERGEEEMTGEDTSVLAANVGANDEEKQEVEA